MDIHAIDPRAVEYVRKNKVVETSGNDALTYKVRFIGQSELVIESNSFNGFPTTSIHLSNVREVWLGCGREDDPYQYKDDEVGNMVLIRQNRVCYYVGISVEKFTLRPREYIVNMLSTIGNSSGVPYGYLVTNTRYIFLQNNCGPIGYIPKKELEMQIAKAKRPIYLSCLDDDIKTHIMKRVIIHSEHSFKTIPPKKIN